MKRLTISFDVPDAVHKAWKYKGRRTIALLDKNGDIIDTISFFRRIGRVKLEKLKKPEKK